MDSNAGEVFFGTAGMVFAELLRPKSIDDIAGQKHLLSKGAALRRIIETGTFDSLIFVGPPGTGKTTLARIAGELLSMPFIQLHATTAGATELKKISDTSSPSKPSLVFIDEIHRYNKSQQNLLLKLVDDRYIKIIGASTENPTFSLVPAFRSRSLIFNFKALTEQDINELAGRAIEKVKSRFSVEEVIIGDVVNDLMYEAAGDARRFLNLLEISAMLGIKRGDTLTLSTDGLEDLVKKRRFDDDEYYDLLSAMIKSIRGSDPDAALLWSLKLVKSGVAPEAVFRRLLISASEDIGNAYPDALVFTNSAYQAFMNVGLPEGMIIFSHTVVYLATCPKSNRAYLAMHKAEEYLTDNDPVVPSHINNSAIGYVYPHNFGGFVKQEYRPKGADFYDPSDNGFEQKIADRLKRLWNE